MSTEYSTSDKRSLQDSISDENVSNKEHQYSQGANETITQKSASARAKFFRDISDATNPVSIQATGELFPGISAEKNKTEQTKGEQAGYKMRICLLEDPYGTAETLKEQLDGHDYVMDQFYSIKDGHAALLSQDYDLMIISRPIGAVGVENFINSLLTRDKRALRKVPIIVVTADLNIEILKNLDEAGADAVIKSTYQGDLNDIVIAVVARNRDRQKSESSPRALSVCIFEDSHALGQIFVRNLRECGHAVDYFSDTDETLSSLATKQYNLLIVGQNDYNEGQESLQLIESFCKLVTPEKRKFPIVVLTSDTSSENIKEFTTAGANVVMAKRINGELNHKIFEIAQIISTIPSTKRTDSDHQKSDLDSVPVLDLDIPLQPNTNHQPSAQQPSPNQSAQQSLPPRQSKESGDSSSDKSANDLAHQSHAKKPNHLLKKMKYLPLVEKKWLLIFGVAMSVLLTLGFVLWEQYAAVTDVDVVEARQGALSKSIRGSGKIVTRKQVDLTSATSGQLAKVFVEEGRRVKKGDLLAILDDREARINLRRAEAVFANIKSDLALKTQSLSELKQTPNPDRLSGLQMKDIEAGFNSVKAKYRIAEEELRAAQSSLERLKIVAPFDALILESYAHEGSWVAPPEPLFKLIDPARLEIAILVKGVDARGIVVGQPVVTSSSASAGDVWEGQVTHVGLDGNDLLRDAPVLIYASLGKNTPAVHYGQPMDSRIITKTSQETIKLPFEAIFDRDGKTMVAIVENRRVKFQPVDVGIRDLAEVEIVNGLRAGQPVIMAAKGLEPGVRVKPLLLKEEKVEDESGFPYRAKYSDVAILTTEQLSNFYDNALIVDVRSNFEFDVVHINKAVNIPIASENFLDQLAKLRGKNDSQYIVFYCNGHTCTKSYKAVQAAAAAGFREVYAYDSGIFDWLRANRDYTTLLDTTPAPFDKLVSNDYFQSRLLSFERFKEKAETDGTVVIDIRDDLQKGTKLAMPSEELPLDKLLKKLKAGEYKDRQLLIFDATGHQVRWLQYVLKNKGYENYYFLRDGIDGVTS